MYEFRIHQDAISNFDSKALSIVKKVSFVPYGADTQPIRGTGTEKSGTEQPQSSGPDFHVSRVITESDIRGRIATGQVDRDGNRISCQWDDESGQFSISDRNYSDVRSLAAQLLKIQDIDSAISRDTVEELICEWARQFHMKITKQSFIEFFRTEAGKRVCKLHVWAPIRGLCIQKAFKLGMVTFEPIDRARIDEWERQSLEKAKEHTESIKKYFKNKVRPVQGYAAVVMEVTAEQKKAQDLLLDEANKALGLVRIFASPPFFPSETSPCVLWDTGHDQSFILIVDDGKFVGSEQRILGPSIPYVMLNSDVIDNSFILGLHRLHEMLASSSRSDLEEAVLEAVLLYSRCTIAKEPADKLVYILVGIESILLKDSNEPITQNLSDRIAFLVGRDLQQRRDIVQSTKKAYKLRSDFVHHGASIESLEILQKFMDIAWRVILALIDSTRQLRTRQELLDHLDDKRLS